MACSLPVTLSIFDVVAREEREDEADFPEVDIMVPPVVDGGPAPKCFNIHLSSVGIGHFTKYCTQHRK